MPRIIAHQHFPTGLRIEDEPGVIVRDCTFTHPEGRHGLALVRCDDARVERCQIRRVGNESEMTRYIDRGGYTFLDCRPDTIGLMIEDSSRVTVSACDISEIFGEGVFVCCRHAASGQLHDVSILDSRITYVLEDGIAYGSRSNIPHRELVLHRGGQVARNLVHNTGLGLNGLHFARHGMYLGGQDLLVEDNHVYNCFFGQGISMRTSGIIRRNTVRNCRQLPIAYWPQSCTQGGTRRLLIEQNRCRQDLDLLLPMRHVGSPEKRSDEPTAAFFTIGYSKDANVALDEIVLRDNHAEVGPDFDQRSPLFGGHGDPQVCPSRIECRGNTLVDRRSPPSHFGNLPAGVILADNHLLTV